MILITVELFASRVIEKQIHTGVKYINMEKKLIKTKDLNNNNGQIIGLAKNPRFIKSDRFDKLKKSIEENPEMLELREIIAYDNTGELVVICGNMRLRACKELGIKEVMVKILPQSTDVNKLKAYTIKDNVEFGANDFDLLANEWDTIELENWGVDLPKDAGFAIDLEDDKLPEEKTCPNCGIKI